MTSKIIKCTTKGQITLPITWRKKCKTDNFILEINEQKIVIKPFQLQKLKEKVIFDADEDNKGQGIPLDQMIQALKKIKK